MFKGIVNDDHYETAERAYSLERVAVIVICLPVAGLSGRNKKHDRDNLFPFFKPKQSATNAILVFKMLFMEIERLWCFLILYY
jgi:hypothetical protein